jgi:hypothetical protein
VSINRSATPFVALVITVVAAVVSTQCGGSNSPAAASTTLAMSGVSFTSASVVAGGSGQGTVSLTGAALTGGASISLSSSNTAVATVPASVMVPAGSTSATFNVAAVGAGTATITASLTGSTNQSATLTVTAGSKVSSILLGLSSVVGGRSVNGTAVLTAAAPPGGAVVELSTNGPVSVPSSITVAAGSASATFTIQTRAVDDTTPGTISGAYGGASASAVLSVTSPTVATASFGVAGPTESDTCTLADNGLTLNCTFNGTSSTAPGNIVAWDWSYTIATTVTQTTSGPVLTRPAISCSFLPPPPLPAGTTSFPLTVKLTIHDDEGHVSAQVTNPSARLLPQGACGF